MGLEGIVTNAPHAYCISPATSLTVLVGKVVSVIKTKKLVITTLTLIPPSCVYYISSPNPCSIYSKPMALPPLAVLRTLL
jgi:hypothetical protein